MLDEIYYPFTNFNGATVEVWEWVSNLIIDLLGVWLIMPAGIEVDLC